MLPQSFFARDVVVVARELLGKQLRRDGVVLKITEVEAYRWPGDTACHARSGKTERNAAIWGPPGQAYVYLCYGIHHMLNLVAEPDGKAAAVLVRACEPLEGLDVIKRRRGGKSGPVQLTGPGKVGQALALDTTWSFHRVFERSGLTVHDADAPARVLCGPRVGIDYALPEHRSLPWRFAEADSAWVSQPKGLKPMSVPSNQRRRRRAKA